MGQTRVANKLQTSADFDDVDGLRNDDEVSAAETREMK